MMTTPGAEYRKALGTARTLADKDSAMMAYRLDMQRIAEGRAFLESAEGIAYRKQLKAEERKRRQMVRRWNVMRITKNISDFFNK